MSVRLSLRLLQLCATGLHARWLGLRAIEGEVLRENSTMLAMCRELGFAITSEPNDPHICVVTLPLAQ